MEKMNEKLSLNIEKYNSIPLLDLSLPSPLRRGAYWYLRYYSPPLLRGEE